MIDLYRVVHHQFGRRQGIDRLGFASQGLHGVAHRGQVHDRRHAGEVLQDDAGGTELQFGLPGKRIKQPVHGSVPVRAPQQVLQQDLAAVGQFPHPFRAKGSDVVIAVRLTVESEIAGMAGAHIFNVMY